MVAAHTVLGLQVADNRLDCGAAPHLTADRLGDAADLVADPNSELLRMIEASKAAAEMFKRTCARPWNPV